MFRSLRERNFRLFFAGMTVSLTGTWMETTGRAWLALELSGDPSAVGIAVGLNYLPVLVLGPFAGLVVDRSNKRRLLVRSQALMATTSLVLATVVLTGVVELWMLYALSACNGIGLAFENPGRRSFIPEMVPREDVANAVGLQSSLAAIARTVGPAIAGLVIAAFGTGLVFLANATSYLASMGALQAMERTALRSTERLVPARGQVREGLRYAATDPRVRLPLVMLAVVGTLAYAWPVTVPLVTTQVFAAGPRVLGVFLGAIGVGSLAGSLAVAASEHVTHRSLALVTLAFGVVVVVTAYAPTVVAFGVLLVLTGALGTAFVVLNNGVLQLEARDAFRGRVMALVSAAFVGSTAIGGPLAGLVADTWGTRPAFAMGGVAAVLCGLAALASPVVRVAPELGSEPGGP